MAIQTILTSSQQKILGLLGGNPSITADFYLGGGTALAEYYLHHRLSEDLDFFSEKEVDPQHIFSFLKSIQKKADIKKIAAEQSFNRNLFFLHLKNGDIIKTEFTYYPFPRIEKSKRASGLVIDSLLDIAVNKVFTIYQNPRSRDYIDLYCILQKKQWSIDDLIKKAKIKFDWHVDPLQLGSQFLRARGVKDYPRLLIELEPKTWQTFFIQEAQRLGEKVLE